MTAATTDPQRDWEGGWQQLQITVDDPVWLVTERIKLKYLRPMLTPGMRALEVGCGSAKLSALLAAQGLRVWGIDQSASGLRIARRNTGYLGATAAFARADAFTLPFAPGTFDLVFSTGLLEHFADPTRLMRSMIRALKPGGLFFSDVVPLKFSLARSIWYLRGLHKTVDDEHPYTRADVERWMHACGLEDVRVFSSAVVPPLGLLSRLPGGGTLSRLGDPLWTSLDGTRAGDALGFFYLAFGRTPR
jgi:SAM-dependent methyltransferase